MRIAISGWTQSGKSTVAEYLKIKYGFTVIRLDEKLNEICSQHNKDMWSFMSILRELFPEYSNSKIADIQTELCDLFRKTPKTRRPVNFNLIKAVDSLLRAHNLLVWVSWALTKADNVENVVIDGVRVMYDLDTLHENGYTSVKVSVSEITRNDRIAKNLGIVDDVFVSSNYERELDGVKFDYSINGELPVESVYRQVDLIVGALINGQKLS